MNRSDDRSLPTRAHFSFFQQNQRNFYNINRRSTRPDNFVTSVKIFLYTRPCARRDVCCNLQFYICARRVLQFAARHPPPPSPFAIFQTSRGGENFVTVHCVCLITAPVKCVTLYFNIHPLPMWKSIF